MTKAKLAAIKQYVLATLGVGVLAVSLFIGTIDRETRTPAPITVDGQTIEFTWTDDNTSEDLIIFTDKRDYNNGLSSATVYVAVANRSGVAQDIELAGYFVNERRRIRDVSVLTEVTRVGEPITEERCISVEVTGTSSKAATETVCEAVVVGQGPDVVTTEWVNLSQKPRDVLEAVKETQLLSSRNITRKDVEGFIAEGKTVGFPVRKNGVLYYKLEIEYPANDNGNFFLEAIGSAGGYGHLDPWFNANWDYRVAITIDDSKVPATQTNFPVYVDLGDLPADFHTNVKSDGCDIRVVESNETTETAFELVSYDSATDTGELHFIADTLTSTGGGDTIFYIYYGNSAASCYATIDTYGRNNVWTDYEYVYHLGTTSDSTGTTDLTASGGVTAGDIAGTIDDATDFDFSNDYFTGGGADPTTALSVQTWVKYDAVVNAQMQIVNKWNSNQRAYMLQKNESTNTTDRRKLRAYVSSNGTFQGSNVVLSTTALTLGQWYKADFTYSGANTRMRLYVDGALESTYSSAPASIFNSTENNYIGGYPGGILLHNGGIDEVRIRFGELTGDWITTEYNNQSSPSTFYSVGSQETDGGGGGPTRRVIMIQ